MRPLACQRGVGALPGRHSHALRAGRPARLRVVRPSATLGERLDDLEESVDDLRRPWYLRHPLAGLRQLKRFRDKLIRENLFDTSPPSLPSTDDSVPPRPERTDARTADGSYTDLEDPKMGMAGVRFGRNVPFEMAYPDPKLLEPNPREVSRRLMTRREFKPATILNILAAAWIQFQTHGWFVHENDEEKELEIPLESDDDWEAARDGKMVLKATKADDTRVEGDGGPPTFLNSVTHWWDSNQIYGSDKATMDKLRTGKDGKLIIGSDGLIPLDESGLDMAGFNDNWWLGLSVLHTLFVKEHNYLCDELKKQHPEWDDEILYNKARLLIAALSAKVHTVEWTTAIMPHPTTTLGLTTNWWGLLGQAWKNKYGRVGDSDVLGGIPGSPQSHWGCPYALTEEFTTVYRMHPLMPDEFEFRRVGGGKPVAKKDLFEVSGKSARPVMKEVGIETALYSFGTQHPGAVTLHNYPKLLQKLVKDDGEVMDLAAVDIIRDRERGIPRYNDFREQMGMDRVKTFEEINPDYAKELSEVYGDVDSVDAMTGLFAEKLPENFGFSETAFRLFIVMASRRMKCDRFFTDDYTPEVYTQWGLDYVDGTTFVDVIRRHYPKLRKTLEGVENAFAPWDSPCNRDGLQEVARDIVEMKRMAWNNMVGKPNKV
ncbi:unnamed protein product [Ostreobium quekettii]|uniref:Heme peroxidase n=1 Tax=Ostreobium quekettii TaxID=121088 RepID=A0A8S1IK86_9CHLO|nr:unnamed protein product [Ostreobium quekettii]|eukprot:evm.model.scf_15EXC.4 EVM.evm.TU.scf_15EXC.4   scf_15EXC:81178-88207(-)